MKRTVRFVALFVAGFLLFPLLASAQSAPRPFCSMSATPSVIQKGATFNLRWQSTNATAGSITGLGSVGPSGVQGIIVTRPTLFTGTFWGAGGTTTCQASVSFEASGVLPTPAQQLPVGEIRTVGSVQPAGTVEIPTYTPNTSQTLPSAPTLNQDTTPTSGLVPCSGLDCQACHLAKLSQNVINFLVGLSIPIAAAMFAWAGVLMFTAGDSSGKIQKAKDILRSVLVGFLIVICAWLVIQTVLKAILNPAYYSGWNNIQCVAKDARPMTGTFSQLINSALGGAPNTTPQGAYIVPGGGGLSSVNMNCPAGYAYIPEDGNCYNQTTQQTVPVVPVSNPNLSVGGGLTCKNCETIAGGFQIKNGSQVDANYNGFLGQFSSQLQALGMSPSNIAVTEGYPPTANHTNTCHYYGTCTDIGLRGNLKYDPTTVNQIQAAASAAGGCAVFETNSASSCGGVKNCKVYSHVTAPHFSLYQSASCR